MKALLFARLRELAGTDAAEASGATVREAWESLRARFPQLPAEPGAIRAARNQDFVDWDAALAPGDEVAFIPPVSGGGETGVLFELTADPLDPRRLEGALAHPGAGAICTFTGVVRDHSRGEQVERLEYEAYAGMAEKQMRAIALEIGQRWPEARVAMAHRTGVLEIGEASVVVSVSCPHRAEAIAACKHGIDRLKESVPIWKKEFATGGAVWIEGPNATPGPPTPRP
ncbi:MAG: molybdenum cofactor biosynthesis protein MoaE [Chloroflexota bacterium]